jgi:hypothetical protein
MMKWQNAVDEISEADFNVLYLREEIACVPGGALGVYAEQQICGVIYGTT